MVFECEFGSDSDSGSYISATPPRPSSPPSPPPLVKSRARIQVSSRPKPKPVNGTKKSASRSRSQEKLRSSKGTKEANLNSKHGSKGTKEDNFIPKPESKGRKEDNFIPKPESKGEDEGNFIPKPESKVTKEDNFNPKPETKPESEVKTDSDLGRLFESNKDNLPIKTCSASDFKFNFTSSSNISSSFSRLVKSRKPFFDPASEFKPEPIDLKKVEESTSNQVNSKQTKRCHPNSIQAQVQLPVSTISEQLKRPKIQNEGNFIRLNINGYGRKYKKFKNGKRDYAAFRKKRWVRNKFNKTEDQNENNLYGCDGLFEKQKEGLKCNNEDFEKALRAIRQDLNEENLRNLLKLSHGFELFREGQLEAIKRVILGESTMLVLPTGAGKSLCYQIPALMLPGVTLVVSPLISLMIDQLKKLPSILPAGLISSNQTSEESNETLERLSNGEIKVLFVSPERFLNSEFLQIFKNGLSISLLVIDEAHCISEWSHNFRPSYLRLRASLLKRKLNINCILAMTATATNETLENIMHALEISKSNLIITSQIRDNLQLSISSSQNRLKDLMVLMKNSPFLDMKSIIIYCKFQAETDMISKYLCDNNIKAKSYHSGIHYKERSRTQELFCSNKIRVIAATVAFGMGLDKSDVQGVIHYCMPESLEEYIQEIGRAGRDGRTSHCHLFLDTPTYLKIRSLSYSDGVDEYAISKLLDQIFSNDNLTNGISWFIKDSTSRKLDIKEEVLLTALTMLEIGEEQYINLLPQINSTCSLNFHKTCPQLLADKDLLVRSILKQSERKDGNYIFEIPIIANILKIEASEVLDQLKDLKFSDEITYELKDQAYCFRVIKKPNDLFALSSQLTKWLSQVEISKVKKLDLIYKVANFALKECKNTNGCTGSLHTPCIQKHIIDYFGDKEIKLTDEFNSILKKHSPFLHADIKAFLRSNSSLKFTPRAVARIMHGIPSPAFPSSSWSKNHFWGRYMETDFLVVMEAAKVELVNILKKNGE